MTTRDIIVVGASAGGVEPLRTLVSLLPVKLPAAVFIVLHIAPRVPSILPQILSSVSALPVFHARDGTPIEHGNIYVAPPNHHLLVERGHLHLGSGPKESGHRPAVNSLFRSAALSYGSRVIGVVLSGNFDDGAAGLWEIKRRSGIAIVQSPMEAVHPGMPRNAAMTVNVDFSLPVCDIAAKLQQLVRESVVEELAQLGSPMVGKPTLMTCPECRGPLEVFQDGPMREVRCRVGHTFGPEALVNAHEETLERALWAAVVALEEGVEIGRLLKNEEAGEEERQEARRQMASKLREMIRHLDVSATPPDGEAEIYSSPDR